jgi:hypothetical protein
MDVGTVVRALHYWKYQFGAVLRITDPSFHLTVAGILKQVVNHKKLEVHISPHPYLPCYFCHRILCAQTAGQLDTKFPASGFLSNPVTPSNKLVDRDSLTSNFTTWLKDHARLL